MSYKFDKSEVPQFEKDSDAEMMVTGCVACGEYHLIDRMTGLCRPCWRIVILGPVMEAWRNTP